MERPRRCGAIIPPVLLLAFGWCTAAPTPTYQDFPSHVAPSVTGAVNAFFNDASGDGQFGLWIYRASGSCPRLRTEAPGPLVAGFIRVQEGTYDAKGLKYCYILPRDPVNQDLDRCSGGTLTLKSVDPTGRLVGSFDLTFDSGVRREGQFVAEHCSASDPGGR